ncbi:TIGR03943 family protein [Enterococcus plantarum]|uniref:TIGR03943 family putative permease subunit n=1 Tax=Enterococcus plantarum TaxID=1077675 RepID=UPI00084DA592|nr:TIGR03943 family protein [Enterococcus plantarum]OEG14734.1 TIGR03943 family protein [Enterococcus plantarum]
MIRFLILIGYTMLMLFLQVSGRLNQYINVHYSYLAILSMLLSFVLAMVQLILWNKEADKKTEHHHHHEDCHDHGLNKPYQKGIAYVLLAFPLVVGFMFPTVSLDTSIVEAKGFNFPLSKESVGDPDVQTQYLKPDTSIYFDKTDYNKQMEKALTHYIKDDKVTVTEENYLEVMELIYNYPSEFIGKTITYRGFAFNSSQNEEANIFVFRFGIIHCVADSGVFGLLTHMPEGETFKNNDWVEVTGTIHSGYYAPFKREIPMVDVTKVKHVEEPKNQYVYRSF